MLFVGDSRFVDFTAPQSGSSVQFVMVVIVAAAAASVVIMGVFVEVVLACEEMHNYTATLGFTLSQANTFFDCLQDDELPDERSNPCLRWEIIRAPQFQRFITQH